MWLKEIVELRFTSGQTSMDIGFDINAQVIRETLVPEVQSVEHDIASPFDARYHGKFDRRTIR